MKQREARSNVISILPRLRRVKVEQETDRDPAVAPAEVSYFLLVKPDRCQTRLSDQRREHGRNVLLVLFVACATLVFPLAWARAHFAALFLLCVIGTVWLWRKRVESRAHTRAYFFTAIRGPAHERDLAATLLPYFSNGWGVLVSKRSDSLYPEPVFCDPANVQAYDLLDRALDMLHASQRELYQSFTFNYVDPLEATSDPE